MEKLVKAIVVQESSSEIFKSSLARINLNTLAFGWNQ